LKLTEIIGLEEKHANLLAEAGVKEVEDLLPLTRYQIQQLARKLGVTVNLLDSWQEHADLMRISGITPEYANLINKIGIDSVKEFARRNPKSTLEKLKQFKKDNPKVITKIPGQKDIETWIKEAKNISGAPEKKPSKKPGKKDEAPPSVIPKIDYVPIEKFEGDYGEYGPDYWNNKWEKAPIIYTGRALRAEAYKKQIDVDVKTFIKKDDAILWHVITQLELRKETPNKTALAIQNFVCQFLKYKYDDLTAEVEEYWLFPFESIQSEVGDCEDGSILIAALLINAGIPSWRVKVTAAEVIADPIFAPSETEVGGHSYCLYLADRPDSERKLEWVILDWCYLQDPEVPVEKKPLARDGGTEGAYKDVLFTFNDEFSWAQSALEVKEGRISKNRTVKKDEIIAPLEDILKHLANDELLKVFRKFGIDIE
jgi:predicted flap endonuclease-1-like 5' DNA nuclease